MPVLQPGFHNKPESCIVWIADTTKKKIFPI